MQYERFGYVNSLAKWVVRSSNPRNELKNLDLRLDSQVYIISQEGDTVSMEEAYRTAKDMPIMVNSVGVWSPMSRLVMTVLSFWDRRQNLGGLEFVAAILEVRILNSCGLRGASCYCKLFQDPPNIYISHPQGVNGPFEVSGMVYDIWHQFELSSNFRCIIKLNKKCKPCWP